jgi:5-methylcytosine-specific restriction endonuclease McrA
VSRTWGLQDRRRIPTEGIPESVIALVVTRQRGRNCAHCVEVGTEKQRLLERPNEPLEIDHRRPLSLGGTNHWFNLQLLCRSHNAIKGTRQGPAQLPMWARGYPGDRKSGE